MPQIIIGKLVGGGMRLIPVQRIMEIRSNLHIQRVMLKDGETIEIRQSLKELVRKLEELAPGQFISPSKGCLVNVLAVESIYTDTGVLQGGKTFPIANRFYRKFQNHVITYLTTHDKNIL